MSFKTGSKFCILKQQLECVVQDWLNIYEAHRTAPLQDLKLLKLFRLLRHASFGFKEVYNRLSHFYRIIRINCFEKKNNL